MTEIKVIVTGPEEAYDYEAEFWRGNELIGVTVLHEGRLHPRIDPRSDGSPWLADVASQARSLAEAQPRRAAYRGGGAGGATRATALCGGHPFALRD